MIKYFKHDEIDKIQWDECVDNSTNELIYAYSWYLDIICEDWDALIKDDYDSVFPLPFRIKRGVKYCYQPFFAQQLGVFSKTEIGEKIQDFLLNIPSSFRFVEINLNSSNNAAAQGFSTSSNNNFELNLSGSYDEISLKYSKNLKRNLKLAKTQDIEISANLRPEQIVKLFQENMGKTLSTYKAEDYKHLIRLIYQCQHLSIADTYGAFNTANELIAGAVFLKTKHKTIFLFSSNSEAGKKSGALPLLIDQHIRRYSGNKIILDFEGSNDENLARFYKGFGSSCLQYEQLTINRFSSIEKVLFALYKKFLNS